MYGQARQIPLEYQNTGPLVIVRIILNQDGFPESIQDFSGAQTVLDQFIVPVFRNAYLPISGKRLNSRQRITHVSNLSQPLGRIKPRNEVTGQ